MNEAPSLDDLAALAEAAFADLPEGFRVMTGDVVFRVDDFATPEVLAELGIEDAFELTGLYQGVDVGRRSLFDPSPEPSRIFLYRRPIQSIRGAVPTFLSRLRARSLPLPGNSIAGRGGPSSGVRIS